MSCKHSNDDERLNALDRFNRCNVADTLYCNNTECHANEENRCMAMFGDCTIHVKPNDLKEN